MWSRALRDGWFDSCLLGPSQALALLDALAGDAGDFWEAYANEVLPRPQSLALPLCLPPRLLLELQHAEVIQAAQQQKVQVLPVVLPLEATCGALLHVTSGVPAQIPLLSHPLRICSEHVLITLERSLMEGALSSCAGAAAWAVPWAGEPDGPGAAHLL